MTSRWMVLLGSLAIGFAVASCGAGDGESEQGSGGTGGTAGKGGSGGTGGSGGATGGSGGATGGTGGATGGTGGATGGTGGATGGTGGATGGTGGGTGGGAGAAGSAGEAGSAGAAGSAGEAGSAGAAGSAGSGGAAGSAGQGGGGAAGSAGSAGAAGAGPTPCGENADCDDSIFCNGVETCVDNFCVAGTEPSCDDTVPCTADFCNTTTDACNNVPQDALCSNGLFCDGIERCTATGCAAGTPPTCNDGVPCTDDSCDEANKACLFVPNHAKCSNNDVCDGLETCTATGCQGGISLNCNDGVLCTDDTCDPLAGCVNTPDDTFCDDPLFCNGSETCDPDMDCVGGVAPCAPDGVSCTVDCNEGNNTCSYAPNHTLCPAGQICRATQGCIPGTACTTHANCNDNLACNGQELCVGNICQAGSPLDCNDSIACTNDSCDDTLGACVHEPVNGLCSDGDFCNGTETCHVTLGCQLGTVPSCDDGVACTIDQCITSLGGCSNIPDHAACDNNIFCDGWEVCTSTGCASGSPVFCPDDGIACTVESCSETAKACVTVADDSLCTDPNEDCVPGTGCINTCVVTTCQGKVYQCGNCLDDDNDGLIDSKDPDCLGACDNNERGYQGQIPGQNEAPCKQDCYFDGDTGAGNDNCYWSHKCDPLSVPPDYPPEGSKCAYNPNSNIPGFGGNCAAAMSGQSAACLNYCLPLVPNGCDCFGCCEFPQLTYTVWLGSEVNGTGSCNLGVLTDKTKCKPCTVVPSCWNDCEECELCLGKTTLPPQCNGQQQCPPGVQACGLPGQDSCPSGFYCITGCCMPLAE